MVIIRTSMVAPIVNTVAAMAVLGAMRVARMGPIIRIIPGAITAITIPIITGTALHMIMNTTAWAADLIIHKVAAPTTAAVTPATAIARDTVPLVVARRIQAVAMEMIITTTVTAIITTLSMGLTLVLLIVMAMIAITLAGIRRIMTVAIIMDNLAAIEILVATAIVLMNRITGTKSETIKNYSFFQKIAAF